MNTTRPRVVVAVGHEPADSALAFAVEEAQRLEGVLHVVHVERIVVGGPDAMVLSQLDIERIGRANVEEAVARVKELAPDLEVEVEVFIGGVVPTVVEVSEGAALVVLEHRALPRWERLITRSVAGGVAAKTTSPAVSVPEGWKHAEGPAVVTVGVDVPERSAAVIRAAAEQATKYGAKLRVIHAWNLPPSYDGMVTPEESVRWAERSESEVREAVDAVPETAGLDVEIEICHGRPADELLQAAKSSSLMVLGRHDSLIPFGSHLGPVVRAVLRDASAPVLVVDPRG
jgi:nucleotide-binding universal stress UspA family protein